MIKKSVLALGCLFSLFTYDNVVFASDFATIHPVAAKGVKWQGAQVTSPKLDLSRFGQAVGDKRLVLLDELTHGENNVFDLKRQVIEYLHQHKGFDLLLLESGIYDVSRIWANDKQSIKAQAPGNIFYMYANNPSIHQLFDYIDSMRGAKRPLYLAGFDGRLSGQLSLNTLVSQQRAFVNQHYANQLPQFDWDFFDKVTQQILKRDGEALNQLADEQRFHYLNLAHGLADLLAKQQVVGEGYESSTFWAQVVKGNAMVGQQLWQQRRFDENDLIMAENVDWVLKTLYPNKKAIIWGHFVHVNRQGLGPNRYANVGTELIKRYPGQVYVAHFAGATGQFVDFITMKTKKVPTENVASFETSILKQPLSVGFIDRQDVNFAHPKAKQATVWGYDYASTIPLNQWPNLWDGMFWLDKVTAK